MTDYPHDPDGFLAGLPRDSWAVAMFAALFVLLIAGVLPRVSRLGGFRMSPSFATIPNTAPFTEEDVALLNQVVGPASAVQRAWLAGFLAGVESVQGGQDGQAAQPAAPARPAEPLTIVYASESGNCEKLANDFAKSARKNGLKPTLIDMADLEPADLTDAKKLIFIAATWGEGEPPARAVRSYGELMGEGAPRLDGVEFGVLALGDTAYVEFCAIGKAIDARLEALGGKRVVDRVDCDLDFAEPAGQWIGDAIKTLAPPLDEAARGRVSSKSISPTSRPAPPTLSKPRSPNSPI